MLTSTEALAVGTLIIGAFQAYVSLRVLVSTAYSGGQKLRQFLGAVLVLLFMETDSAPATKRDAAFTAAPGGNPEGIGGGDGHV